MRLEERVKSTVPSIGEVEGATIAWSVDVLAAKKPVIVLTFAAPEFLEKNAADLVKLIESIKKSE